MQKENILMICPNEEKIKILENTTNDKELKNIKFMTKEEYISNYFFSYDNKTISYLINKYNYNLDVCKVYLKNLYPIDINKEYQSKRLNFLKDLKKELLDNNLLIINDGFKEYLKDKKIIVKNYYEIDKYEELALNFKLEVENNNLNLEVVKCINIEEEVNDVCLKIIELINKGINLNNIYLSNVQSQYLYIIEKLFNYYNIPINLNNNSSIYSTKVVKDYLNTKELDLNNKDNLPITKKLIKVLSSLTDIEDTNTYNLLLIDKLKNTKMNKVQYKEAVNIKDLYKTSFTSNDYVFVLGFNQDVLPSMSKDIEFISDKDKEELDMYTTKELNVRRKKVLINILSNISNLNISYNLSSPFNTYYKSSLIDEYNLKEIEPIKDNLNKSNIYNKLRLGEKLDKYYLYGENNNELELLNNHYDILYNSYDNSFSGIDNNIYLSYIKEPLNISYSSMNNYNECNFKYYINNVLKIDTYEEQFHQFIGNLYHTILSLKDNKDFDIEKEYKYYLENSTYNLTIKDRLLLVKIKKDLIELIDSINKQELLTTFNNKYYEKRIEIELPNNKIQTIFKGFIDKILYLDNIEETYYSIIDYKTGSIDTHIEPMKYGLHMQLPVYMYLIKNSNLFKNPKFTGIYYQNILFNYPSCNDEEELLKIKEDRLKLQGYSIDNPEILELFDKTYQNSSLIKSMKYSEDKGFYSHTKVIDEETSNKMIDYTKKIIDETSKNIINSKFDINPKYYDKENISCKYCNYKDICYMKDKDVEFLTKVEDLSFLDGGEENA